VATPYLGYLDGDSGEMVYSRETISVDQGCLLKKSVVCSLHAWQTSWDKLIILKDGIYTSAGEMHPQPLLMRLRPPSS